MSKGSFQDRAPGGPSPSQMIGALTLILEEITGEKVVITKEKLDQFNTRWPVNYIPNPATGSIILEVPMDRLKQEEVG